MASLLSSLLWVSITGTKAMNFDIKSASLTRYTPCYAVFDVLYLNDEVLTNRPLRQRLNKLTEIIDPEDGLIFTSTTTNASSKYLTF